MKDLIVGEIFLTILTWQWIAPNAIIWTCTNRSMEQVESMEDRIPDILRRIEGTDIVLLMRELP